MTPLPNIRFDPVVWRADAFHVRIDAWSIPLRLGQEPVTAFVPGWQPTFLYTGFAPFFILNFDHDDETACWLLDGAGQRLGGSVSELGVADREKLRVIAAPLLRRLVWGMVTQAKPVLDADVQAFLLLPPALRRELAALCTAAALLTPQKFVMSAHPDHWDSTWIVSRPHVEALLSVSFQDRLLAASWDGALSWPNPVDGSRLIVQGSLCADDFHFAYRLVDEGKGLVTYVLVGHHHATILGLYIPALNLVIVRDGASDHLYEVYFANVSAWMVDLVCRHAEVLEPYLAAGASQVANLMRGLPNTHIGHQLWNEIAGADHFLRSVGDAPLPVWVLPGGAPIELWGAIDAIFPRLKGRVDRSAATVDAAIRNAYQTGLCLVRITSEHVSEGLRQTLQHGAMTDPVWGQVQDILGQVNPRQAPVILLGLRVENRTAVNLLEFCQDLVKFVATAWPGAVLIVDGHNTDSGGDVIDSYAETLAVQSPLSVERQIAENLKALEKEWNVTVLDTLGASIRTSLAWCSAADCFFSFWGASLSKYRWVCNKPGLVITSHLNLVGRADLHIYDAPEFMDEPSHLDFVDPGLVVDVPEAPLLVDPSPGTPRYFNFRADADRVFKHLHQVIEASVRRR